VSAKLQTLNLPNKTATEKLVNPKMVEKQKIFSKAPPQTQTKQK
jgi:hypothetical protein